MDSAFELAVSSVPEAKPQLRGVLHVGAALAAIPATAVLAVYARVGTATTLACIYGISLVLVLGTSGLFHTPNWSIAARRRMQRLDHSMIYVLIASSYAPFAFRLESLPRNVVLAISIGGGLLGWVKVHAWPRAPRHVTSAIYVLIGWCMAPYFPELYASIGLHSTCLLLIGGVFYTCGALIYWLRVPNPWPRTFGYHEVNHLFGLVGAVCHYIAIWSLLT
ncbi:MAG TPA: hemolysin III family protein [Polyangiaceae bacterium]|nr:hemolysin III family protein [Polyangiaceae bacterium]